MESFAFPGVIDNPLCRIAARQVPYMRTSEFSDVVLEIQRRLLDLAHCHDGRVIPLTASGTGAMDAVTTNYLAALGRPDAPVLIIDAGGFGKRWKSLCRYYDIPHVGFDIPFCDSPDYDALDACVRQAHPSVIVTEHDETSSGLLLDLQRIGSIARLHGCSLVVDAISSFLVDPLRMDDWGIDICITSSQKGLNVHPGVAFVIIAHSLIDFPWEHRSFYFDFQENLHNLTRGQTPYSPATMIFLQCLERLRSLEQQGGVEAHIALTRRKALHFRQALDSAGIEMPVRDKSNAVTGFRVPSSVASSLFRDLIDRGFFIMPGGDPSFFRVSHMGDGSHLALLDALLPLISKP